MTKSAQGGSYDVFFDVNINETTHQRDSMFWASGNSGFAMTNGKERPTPIPHSRLTKAMSVNVPVWSPAPPVLGARWSTNLSPQATFSSVSSTSTTPSPSLLKPPSSAHLSSTSRATSAAISNIPPEMSTSSSMQVPPASLKPSPERKMNATSMPSTSSQPPTWNISTAPTCCPTTIPTS